MRHGEEQTLLEVVVSQRNRPAATLEEPKYLQLPAGCILHRMAETVAQRHQFAHPLIVLLNMTVPIRDLRYYFDREIDVTGPISIRVQHAAKQGNPSHPSQIVRVAVDADDAFHERG